MICGDVSYHNYGGIVIDEEMKAQIAKDLGPNNFIMILRNHGVVVCGRTIEETWHYMYNFMYACEIQLNALSAKNTEIIYPSKKAIDQVKEVANRGGGGVNVTKSEMKWGLGELEFEAEMRLMDSMVNKS
jgi:adducin